MCIHLIKISSYFSAGVLGGGQISKGTQLIEQFWTTTWNNQSNSKLSFSLTLSTTPILKNSSLDKLCENISSEVKPAEKLLPTISGLKKSVSVSHSVMPFSCSSIHGILRARILGLVVILFSRGRTGDRTRSPALQTDSLPTVSDLFLPISLPSILEQNPSLLAQPSQQPSHLSP